MAIESCHERASVSNKNLTKEQFADLYEPAYALNSHSIRRSIDSLMRTDDILLEADRYVRRYYSNHRSFIWIDRNGVLPRADSALYHLREAIICGIDTNRLRVRQIADDIQHLRNLDVEEKGRNSINKTMARVEYYLTRAVLRYSAGQNFGFVNPDKIYNSLEKKDSDTITNRVTYFRLSDLRVKRPDSTFFNNAIRKMFKDSVGGFIESVQPHNPLYKALVGKLNSAQVSSSERIKILCNIERCRWRISSFGDFSEYKKYVLVNIPSCSLRAVKDDDILTMRVAVGTLDHKTPLLASSIKRMDINPQWIIPLSIAKGIAGRTGYMHKEGMFVYDKNKGKLPPESLLYTRLMDGKQFIVQAGGEKNPLGRIIFRFDNNFSVYLHDTSSPWLLQRANRTLSHGCIRLEKPADLALFLYDGKDDEMPDKIKYSMTMPFISDNDSTKKINIDQKRVVSNVTLAKAIPIFITYYTMFFADDGSIAQHDDIYGYDEAIKEFLRPFNK